MKCSFTLNGKHYHAPSFKEARKFLKKYGESGEVYRFQTTWKFKHVERAPSYQQMMVIMDNRVEFRSF